MKVLILTTATGQGHNEAAEALRQKYEGDNHQVTVLDFIPSNFKLTKTFIVHGYELLATKYPVLYGTLYKITNSRMTSVSIDLLLKKAEKCVFEEINKEVPDIIIGTHPFAVKIISSLNKLLVKKIPFISVVTDFKPHYSYIDQEVDAYVTGSEYTKETLCMNNISKNKVFTYGIPIKEEFYECSKRKINDKFTILLMGGSMGLMIIEKVVENLINNANDIKVIVVCGKNNILYNNLNNNYKEEIFSGKIEVLGFTRNVCNIMENADVIITKPGGLTVCEAISKRLPMIVPFAIPGQEKENLDFLVNSGAAIKVKDIKVLNKEINFLISNPNRLTEMKKSMESLGQNYSLDKIVSLSERLAMSKPFKMIN